MVAGENKKSLDSRDQKDLPVVIIMCSLPEIFCEEIIHSGKNDDGTPVFGRRVWCHSYFDVSPNCCLYVQRCF